MPNWNDILNEIRDSTNTFDGVRRKYLRDLHDLTDRNVIIYYSGWLNPVGGGNVSVFYVSDADKTGFMTAVHGLDRDKGLDLLLHTPGGDVAATESLVNYLRKMFDTNIRAIIPELALSAGTMIACACDEIVMGKQSSLGPIDPQFGGVPAHGIVTEFERAKEEIRQDPSTAHVWQVILSKYSKTLIGSCELAIDWAEGITGEWLKSGMFRDEDDPEAEAVVNRLGDPAETKSHRRHIPAEQARDMGLRIVDLEDDDDLQDAVLSVHHATMITLERTAGVKIIENHTGDAVIRQMRPRN